MPTRLVHMVIDANDPQKLARFWAAALGWVVEEEEGADEADVWPAGYEYPDPVALPIVFVPVPEPKAAKNRVHLDLASRSSEHQASLVERVRDLGARPLDIGQGGVPWVVLADPEGNEFCVLEPRDVYRDTGPVAAVVVDSVDPPALAGFWELASGWVRARTEGDDLVAFRSPRGVGPYLELLRVPEAKTVKNRVHLDVAPDKDEDQAAAARQLRGAGAVPADVRQGADVSWVVLADPDGNEFCVLTPR
jgi:catechol 2,3-dioxygenase-like lactoylglutathione lyase family enzyme